jgi:hypothetical protein
VVEILFTPVGTGAIRQLFQVCFIGHEFTGSSGPATPNSRRNQNYLAGALVSEAGGYCVVFGNIAVRGLCADLPRA